MNGRMKGWQRRTVTQIIYIFLFGSLLALKTEAMLTLIYSVSPKEDTVNLLSKYNSCPIQTK